MGLDRSQELRAAGDAARHTLDGRHRARERTLPICRDATRQSALAIRATHRGELDDARAHIQAAGQLLATARHTTRDEPAVRDAGFVHDAQKEFAEATLTLAFVADEPLPERAALHVEAPAYLHGLAEAASELRRAVLDRLRTDDTDDAQRLFTLMEDSYTVLVTIDYPDALTSGLRRATDALRAVLERTRGDITNAVVLARIDAAISKHLLDP